jgi:hypothetical protein
VVVDVVVVDVVAEAEVAVLALRRVSISRLPAVKSPVQCSKVALILKSRKAQPLTSRRSGIRFVR